LAISTSQSNRGCNGPLQGANFFAAATGEHRELDDPAVIVVRVGKPDRYYFGIGQHAVTRCFFFLVRCNNGVLKFAAPFVLANGPTEECG
jgi:hypothetical protein